MPSFLDVFQQLANTQVAAPGQPGQSGVGIPMFPGENKQAMIGPGVTTSVDFGNGPAGGGGGLPAATGGSSHEVPDQVSPMQGLGAELLGPSDPNELLAEQTPGTSPTPTPRLDRYMNALTHMVNQKNEPPEEFMRSLGMAKGPTGQWELDPAQTGGQVGADLATALGTRETMAHHKELMDSAATRYEQAINAFNHPGLPADEVSRLQSIVVAGSSPRATTDQKNEAAMAQQQLNAATKTQKDEPGWSRFATGIAVALGAFGASLTKTPNYALEYINAEANREAERQEREWKRREAGVQLTGNAFAHARQVFQDDIAAHDAALGMIYRKLGMRMEGVKLVTMLNEQEQQHKMAALERMALIEEKLALEGGKTGKMDPNDAQSVQSLGTSLDILNQLQNTFNQEGVSGPASKVSGMGGSYTKSGRYNDLRDSLMPKLEASLVGSKRFAEGAAKLLMKGIPAAGGSGSGSNIEFNRTKQQVIQELHMIDQKYVAYPEIRRQIRLYLNQTGQSQFKRSGQDQ